MTLTYYYRPADGDHQIWASLEPPVKPEDLVLMGESFIIGCGSSKAAAVTQAVVSLRGAVEQLENLIKQ